VDKKARIYLSLLDDGFLSLAPDWYRHKAKTYITVVTDLARLLYARQCLQNGFDRIVWVDADIVIFSPSLFTIAPEITCGYCREVRVSKDPSGVIVPEIKVNNAVCVFARASFAELNQYINDCYSIVRTAPAIRSGLEVGTRFLTKQHASEAVISKVGFIRPANFGGDFARMKIC
jgi:hypothetical protein